MTVRAPTLIAAVVLAGLALAAGVWFGQSRPVATSVETAPVTPLLGITLPDPDGKDQAIDVSKVDVSMNGIELQDREFVAAIRDRREPNASVAQVLPCYRTLHELDQQLQEQP